MTRKFTYDTITVKGEKMAVLPVAEVRSLLDFAEELEDTRDLASFIKRLDAGDADTIPGEVVHRIIAGENPLRVWREFRGLTQKELEAKSGIPQGAISNIEKGKTAGTVKTIKALAKALEVSIEDILDA